MKRKRFRKSRSSAFCGRERGPPNLAREHGVSEATIYNWKAKYAGMDVSDAKRLKALEEENARGLSGAKREPTPTSCGATVTARLSDETQASALR
jgi:putative transposase